MFSTEIQLTIFNNKLNKQKQKLSNLQNTKKNRFNLICC